MNSELGIRNVGCVLALVMTFFTACTDYQEQFDNNFAALEYGDIENPELSSGVVPGSSGGSTTASSASVSSGAEPLSSGAVPASSGDIQSSSSNPYVEENILTDARDSNKYKLVTIGSQVWMAENLNFETEKSRCYDNSNGNCLKYGRLYTWADAQSVCPEGTHLPSYDEFNALYKYVHEEQQSNGSTEAKFLKSKEGWKDYNGKKGGDDTYGFSALPAGLFADTGYVRIGEFARFLTSDTTDDGFVKAFGMDYNNTVFSPSRYTKTYAISVRCLVGPKKAEATSSSSALSSSSSAPCYTDKAYNGTTEFCFKDSIYKKCDGKTYNPEMEYCRSENNSVQQLWYCDVEGAGYYNPESLYCDDAQGLLHLKACGDTLIRQDEYCYRHGKSAIKVGKMESCNGNLYNPLTYFCRGSNGGIMDRYICSNDSANEDHLDIDLRYNMRENNDGYEEFCDLRDKQVYGAQKIGDNIWMTQNLNYDMDGSYRPNTNQYSAKYGRYYTWNAAMAACPSGWHLPSVNEFKKLIKIAGGEGYAGRHLKSTSMWYSSGAGIDDFGFAALPAGLVDNKGDFYYATNFTYFWSSEDGGDPSSEQALRMTLRYDSDDAQLVNAFKDDVAYSVRCVQGEFSVTPKSEAILGRQYSVVSYNEEEGNLNRYQKWMAENLQYWDSEFKSTEKTCFDQNEYGLDSCEKYGRYYNQEEALSIHNRSKSTDDCWILPDSQEVKELVGIVSNDLPTLYSVELGGNNKSGFNLLPAGYYNPDFTNLLSNKKIKTCFWIRLGDVGNGIPEKLTAYCFYSASKLYTGDDGFREGVEMNVDAEKTRMPIRLIYNKNYCLTH